VGRKKGKKVIQRPPKKGLEERQRRALKKAKLLKRKVLILPTKQCRISTCSRTPLYGEDFCSEHK